MYLKRKQVPYIQSKLGNKTLYSQTQEFVNNVHSFIKSEAAACHELTPLKKYKREQHGQLEFQKEVYGEF
jgi:hypothetical protein